MKINWNLVLIFLIGGAVVAFAIITLPNNNNNSNPDKLLLESCEKLIERLSTENISNIPMKMVTTGTGRTAAYTSSQTLIFWKSDELKVDIKCLGRGRNKRLPETIVDQFIINGEDLTNLVRREERKE